MMPRFPSLLLLSGWLLLLSGCDAVDPSASSLGEQLRVFIVDFMRNALAAYLI